MRTSRLGPLFVFGLLLSVTAAQAQQATTAVPRDAQAVALLQRSLAALVSTNTINDVTMSGNAIWIAGSDNQTGTVTLKGTGIGQGRIDLSLSNGLRSEVIDLSNGSQSGSWCGPDGTWHAMTGHNLFSDPSWFFPTFLIARVLSTANYAVTTADVQTKDGISVEHFAVYQQIAQTGPSARLIANLSRIDIYLDSSTLLPVAVGFNIHPDNDALTNIPTEIRFSNYQSAQGVAVPHHIQKYIQNGLTLDVAVTSIQLNTGIAATDFQAQ